MKNIKSMLINLKANLKGIKGKITNTIEKIVAFTYTERYIRIIAIIMLLCGIIDMKIGVCQSSVCSIILAIYYIYNVYRLDKEMLNRFGTHVWELRAYQVCDVE